MSESDETKSVKKRSLRPSHLPTFPKGLLTYLINRVCSTEQYSKSNHAAWGTDCYNLNLGLLRLFSLALLHDSVKLQSYRLLNTLIRASWANSMAFPSLSSCFHLFVREDAMAFNLKCNKSCINDILCYWGVNIIFGYYLPLTLSPGCSAFPNFFLKRPRTHRLPVFASLLHLVLCPDGLCIWKI